MIEIHKFRIEGNYLLWPDKDGDYYGADEVDKRIVDLETENVKLRQLVETTLQVITLRLIRESRGGK